MDAPKKIDHQVTAQLVCQGVAHACSKLFAMYEPSVEEPIQPGQHFCVNILQSKNDFPSLQLS